MYACIHETNGGFFAGVCRLEDRPLTVRDPLPTASHFANGFFASTASGASRRSESLFTAPISCSWQYVPGRETGLNSAPLIRSYPGSWTWDTWVNKVVEETRSLGFSELKALSFRRYLSYQLASGREASYPSPGLKPTIQPNT